MYNINFTGFPTIYPSISIPVSKANKILKGIFIDNIFITVLFALTIAVSLTKSATFLNFSMSKSSLNSEGITSN